MTTPLTQTKDWEEEFEDRILPYILARMDGLESIRERDVEKLKNFIKKVEAQTRQQTLDECLEIIGEDEIKWQDLGAMSHPRIMEDNRNNIRQELRQAINSLKKV